ncbi:uncharacterized protein [Bos mutus]|uniref:uncharacterized protein isoform X6 n=1 Tax=Bos mutus TaxID=72004 RepID=UPI0038B4871C
MVRGHWSDFCRNFPWAVVSTSVTEDCKNTSHCASGQLCNALSQGEIPSSPQLLFGDHSGDTVSASPGQAPDVAAACVPPVLPGEASWDFCSRQARGILAPQPWIEPASHALEDTGLITGPPGSPINTTLTSSSLFQISTSGPDFSLLLIPMQLSFQVLMCM